MQSGITVCRTAIAHAALLALCGAAHAQQATPTAPTAPTAPAAEKALAPVTVSAGAEQENPTAPVTGFVAKRALSATKTDTPLIETPQAISVITRDQMEAQGVQTLRQVTAYTAGAVSNYFDSRGDTFKARGGDVTQYLDGMVRFIGYWNDTRPDPYTLERVEFLRGPSSVLYGQGSVGGVLNLTSKRPQAETQREVQVQLGSNARKQLAADMTGKLTQDGEWLYRLVAVGRDSDTQVDYVKDDRVVIAPSLTWKPNAATSLTLQGLHQKDKSGSLIGFFPWQGTQLPNRYGQIPTNTFISEPGWDAYDTTNNSWGYLFSHQFNSDWTLRQNLRRTVSEVDYRTIYTSFTAIPGQGLPMENNVFLSANYGWAFYVANGPMLDDATYDQNARWQQLGPRWYASGRPYRQIDQIDGTPNPWLQRWLDHPTYDAYWQSMVPYGDQFDDIRIPVLTITGYYDDGQISALQYFKDHLRHRPDADHALLIGPYDHRGAQSALKPMQLRGHELDPVAQFDTPALTFQWLDHVLRGAPRPALVPDRVNYQLMGANRWGHAATLDAAAGAHRRYHLSAAPASPDGYHRLQEQPPAPGQLEQTVDMADRNEMRHGYYPFPIIEAQDTADTALSFVSAPFSAPMDLVGSFSGDLKVRINKRDFDFTVTVYELLADGRRMQLSYYMGRASHVRDPSTRQLLQPGLVETAQLRTPVGVAARLAIGARAACSEQRLQSHPATLNPKLPLLGNFPASFLSP